EPTRTGIVTHGRSLTGRRRVLRAARRGGGRSGPRAGYRGRRRDGPVPAGPLGPPPGRSEPLRAARHRSEPLATAPTARRLRRRADGGRAGRGRSPWAGPVASAAAHGQEPGTPAG